MTAVEFLIEQFKIYLPSIHQKGLQDAFEQAKEIEKKQIIEAHGIQSFRDIKQGIDFWELKSGEQYYNETYKKDNQ